MIHRATRGAGSIFPVSLHPRRRWGSAWGRAAWCWWRRRGKISFLASFSAGPRGKGKINPQPREWGAGTGVGTALSGDGTVRGGRQAPERHPHRPMPVAGASRTAATLRREVAARCGGSPASAAAHPTRSRPRVPGGAGNSRSPSLGQEAGPAPYKKGPSGRFTPRS